MDAGSVPEGFPAMAMERGAVAAVSEPLVDESAAEPPLPPIVVIDDDQDDAYLLRHRLKKAGVVNPIVHCSGNDEARNYLDMAAQNGREQNALQPQAIFLDLKLSGSSGFDLLQWIRGHERFARTSVYILTSQASEKDRERAYALGATQLFLKFPLRETLAALVP